MERKNNDKLYNNSFTERELKAAIKHKKHRTRRRYHASLNNKKSAIRNNEIPIRLV